MTRPRRYPAEYLRVTRPSAHRRETRERRACATVLPARAGTTQRTCAGGRGWGCGWGCGWGWGWGCGSTSNRAPTAFAASSVTRQVPRPEQGPVQPANDEPPAGIALSTTVTAFGKSAAHAALQLIRPSLLTIDPAPAPVFVTASVRAGPVSAASVTRAFRRRPATVLPARDGIGSPASSSIERSYATVVVGAAASASAATPDTCGVAIDVPSIEL